MLQLSLDTLLLSDASSRNDGTFKQVTATGWTTKGSSHGGESHVVLILAAAPVGMSAGWQTSKAQTRLQHGKHDASGSRRGNMVADEANHSPRVFMHAVDAWELEGWQR